MDLTIDEDIFERFPDLHVGALVLTGVDNSGAPPAVTDLHSTTCAGLAAQAREAVLGDPRILAWRDIYRAMGVHPRKFRSSVEALTRRVLSSGALPRISSVVDIYNAASVRYLLPFGAFDASAIEGALRVRTSPGDEDFTPLGSDETEHTDAGEVIYSDDDRVLTRRWNHRDCDQTKVTEASTDVVVVGEAATRELVPVLEEALSFLATTLQELTGATVVASALLSHDHPKLADAPTTQ